MRPHTKNVSLSWVKKASDVWSDEETEIFLTLIPETTWFSIVGASTGACCLSPSTSSFWLILLLWINFTKRLSFFVFLCRFHGAEIMTTRRRSGRPGPRARPVVDTRLTAVTTAVNKVQMSMFEYGSVWCVSLCFYQWVYVLCVLWFIWTLSQLLCAHWMLGLKVRSCMRVYEQWWRFSHMLDLSWKVRGDDWGEKKGGVREWWRQTDDVATEQSRKKESFMFQHRNTKRSFTLWFSVWGVSCERNVVKSVSSHFWISLGDTSTYLWRCKQPIRTWLDEWDISEYTHTQPNQNHLWVVTEE